MRGFNFDGSHPEVMAACMFARLAEDRILLGEVLKNKTGPQYLAGSERFYSPQALEQLSDSFWDLQGKSIARRPFPGVLWLYMQQHTHVECKLIAMSWPTLRTCVRSSFLHPFCRSTARTEDGTVVSKHMHQVAASTW